MIEIIGEGDHPTEALAAKLFYKLMVAEFPDIERNSDLHCSILMSVTCYKQVVQDIDLLVLFVDSRGLAANGPRSIRSCCLALEVKSHGPGSVKFDGGKCSVNYSGKWHNVSRQSGEQKFSVREYILRNSENRTAPFVTNLIWLVKLPKSTFSSIPDNNIIGSDVIWDDIVQLITTQEYPHHNPFRTFLNYKNSLDVFKKKHKISGLDRRRMEIITKSVLDQTSQQYASKIGEQLLVFRGRGGTGKTVRLIQVAYQIYSEYGFRIKLLTYNKALVADITRLLSHSKAKSGVIGDKAITISTVHSFIYSWIKEVDGTPMDFINNYEIYKNQLLNNLNSNVLDTKLIDDYKEAASRFLEWDMILIDEAQDWPENERDILYKLYGYKNIIIADGVDQFIRKSISTNWQEGISKNNRQIVSLRKSLRLKNNLCSVVNGFAQEMELDGWALTPEDELYGGRVLYVTGNPMSRELHGRLRETNKKDGNSPIDMLFCVPPSWVNTYEEKVNKFQDRKYSTLAEQYKNWGFAVWDGVDEDTRGGYPLDLEEHRIVQYDSCRGLEGWLVVNFALDELYDYKLLSKEAQEIKSNELFMTDEEAQIVFAKRWVMIPMTRAIDTLVIHVADRSSYIGKVMDKMLTQFPDNIEHYHFD
jgi:hypothetical protein